MDFSISEITLLLIGFASTVAGLLIYLYTSIRNPKSFFAYIVVSWLFIPIFPLVFILGFLPDSETTGTLFKFKVSGAFASYVLLWYGGIRLTNKGVKLDEMKSEIRTLEEKCKYVEVINNATRGQEPKPLLDTSVFTYEVKNGGKKIALITGDIANVKDVDVWVNSENTNMQMARFGDKSISAIIRYLGAEKEARTGLVTADMVAKALNEELGDVTLVAPATVLATDSGELRRTHGVRKIFHVASVAGEPASGYKPIERLQDCISNSLKKADDREAFPDEDFRSILFCLMGTGTGGGELDEAVEKLIKAAITYLELNRRTTRIDTVYFLAYTDRDLAACRKVLLESEKVSLTAD